MISIYAWGPDLTHFKNTHRGYKNCNVDNTTSTTLNIKIVKSDVISKIKVAAVVVESDTWLPCKTLSPNPK